MTAISGVNGRKIIYALQVQEQDEREKEPQQERRREGGDSEREKERERGGGEMGEVLGMKLTRLTCLVVLQKAKL